MHAILGIAGHRFDATAAVRVDDELAAAAGEDWFTRVPGVGYAQVGGFPDAAVSACLTRAGIEPADVREIVVVTDWTENGSAPELPLTRGRTAPDRVGRFHAPKPVTVRYIDPIEADALHAAASDPAADLVLVWSEEPSTVAAFVRERSALRPIGRASGGGQLASAARAVNDALGGPERDVYGALEQLGAQGELVFLDRFRELMVWQAPLQLSVADRRLEALVHEALRDDSGALVDPATPHVGAQLRRRSLAASVMSRTAELVIEAVECLSRHTGRRRVVVGGSLFENPRLNTQIRQVLGEAVSFAAIPGSRGRAIGAALSGAAVAHAFTGRGLGPIFSDTDIKETLENCRLDYVYEPDWARLLTRVSGMLARGMVIGWFQGPAPCGPRSLGTRSFLCDPSTPYARENVNGYLRQVPLADPLPVSMTQSAAEACLTWNVPSPFMLLETPVRDSVRPLVRSALDSCQRLRIHTVTEDQASELCDLLAIHSGRTGVPGLININLSGRSEPIACTPRDAVRTMFSSAADALVIGRFLLMKDYWLLRNTSDAAP